MELLALWQTAPGLPPGTNPLTFTMDIAQLVMLGGLIWELAKMSVAIKMLTAVTEKLTLGAQVFSDGLAALVTRVTVLEDRDDERRDRRHDDA